MHSVIRPKVLIVDEDKPVCDTLALIFETNGYEVRGVLSGAEALQVLAEWEPAVAILDVNLGEKNGVELAVAVSNHCLLCRIVLLSGHPETTGILEAIAKSGVSLETMVKPVHPKILLDWAASQTSVRNP